MKRLVRVRVSPSGQSRARPPFSAGRRAHRAKPRRQPRTDEPRPADAGYSSCAQPVTGPLSPQGPRCFSGFFRARTPLLRAVSAKLTRNNRSAVPPCPNASGRDIISQHEGPYLPHPTGAVPTFDQDRTEARTTCQSDTFPSRQPNACHPNTCSNRRRHKDPPASLSNLQSPATNRRPKRHHLAWGSIPQSNQMRNP